MTTKEAKQEKIKTSVLKVIDGLLCSNLPKIFEPLDRKEKLNNAVFSIIGNGEENEEAILKNIKNTLIKTFLDHVKEVLKNHREDLVFVVTSSIVDYSKIIKSISQNKSL